ncbi:MAG TPA: phosphatidylinositol-specific phospholipase C/glycerophosphodiester phosphodiesterase family protein [Bacteroidales bacterium]|nr:phosphatidylinositol-specific phospholipase C/glycerophosphodiester phosphodiesterase family protein [Bacteroidales bacterium]HPM87469.1 phosphatidylinositol-specific phospholipase C/glycerophosphodiester phosphodiesterase family protein [Bacteroidales bacterium]HQM70353.1 phosphatidylinositol-specific phospholipase C/glycerophosphodiester phosphodiesterase family protein [Bacteroidales bacterium]
MKKSLLTIFMLAVVLTKVSGQYTTLNAHSHNDYENDIPFRLAYDNRFGSVEADIWAVNGELYVAHYQDDIKPERTLEALYLNPIAEIFTQNGGRAWKNDTATFQLLIDLKTPVEPTLSILISKLEPLRAVFDPEINPCAVRIVLSGNRPEPAEFNNYPSFIFYDGLLNRQYNEQQLKKVPLYSENLRKFTSWNGDGDIIQTEKNRILGVIDSVHSLNKKIRFWNAPDNIYAWDILIKMRVDYINTDHIIELAKYLNSGITR